MTAAILRLVMPTLKTEHAEVYLPPLRSACEEFEIVPPARLAAFLAQIAHESSELRHWREVWGPTVAQRGYEPPSPKARALGNDSPGDGYRFRGRGPIQLTGRANYRHYGAALGLDLETHPDLVASASVGFRVAGLFWQSRGLSDYADQETDVSFRIITRRINGGLTGLVARERYHAVARQALGLGPVKRGDDDVG